MSSAGLEKIVDIGNEMCGPFLLSYPQLHLLDLGLQNSQDRREGGRRLNRC